MKKIALIGSGDFAISVVEIINENVLYEIVGYIDGSKSIGTIINGIPVIGSDDDVVDLYHKGTFDCIFISVGYTKFRIREKLYFSFKGRVPFANVISPKAIIHPSAQIGEGVMVSDGSVVHKHAVIEDNVAITLHSIVNHGSIVKKHTFFSTRVTTAGNVVVGERCFVGVGVVISDGVKICDDTWLSPGSVVIKNIKKPGHYISTAAKLVNIG